MKVLMVGCGAVGQVFGLFLKKAGVKLGFYARTASARRLEEARDEAGLPLFQVTATKRKNPIPHQLSDYQVITDLEGCRRFSPDQVWFTTPSPVYYSDWYRQFLAEVPSERVVCFAPEGLRPELIPPGIDPTRLVFGGITLIAWQGDLAEGGDRVGSVHYWLPPVTQIPLMGAEAACRPVADLFQKAGVRAAIKKESFSPFQAATTALLSGFTTGLQLSGWSLRDYRRSPWIKRGAGAAREAAAGQLAKTSAIVRTVMRPLFSTPVFSAAAALLPRLAPFDLEAYLRYHYSKTREQSLHLLKVFIQDAEKQAVGTGNLCALLAGLDQVKDPDP